MGAEGKLDIVISEYQLPTENGAYRITGYLRSDSIKEPKEHLYTYFMGSRASILEEGDADINEIRVSGRIVKKGNLAMQKHGRQLLPIIVRCKMDDGRTSIIHAVLFDKYARQVDSYPDVRVASISAVGHINFRHNALEVHIEDAEIFRKEGNSNA